MNCQKAENLLSAFIDRELSTEERRLLRLHLAVCAECAEELRQLEEVKTHLGALTVANIPAVLPWLRAKLAAAEEYEAVASGLVWQSPWFRRTCAAVALLILFGLGSWLLTPQRQDGTEQPRSPLPPLPDASWVRMNRIIR